MMKSWWDIGEWAGVQGEDLAMHLITCPFCMEKGNFSIAFTEAKKNPNSSKRLNFTTLKCGNCAGFVMVLWAHGEFDTSHHAFKVLPWPLQVDKWPKDWPDDVGRYWLQARSNLIAENWDAAALMARSALQVSLRAQNAQGRTLKDEIDDLSAKGTLPQIMREWAHEVRVLGNDSAHPKPGQAPTESKDAKDIVEFLEFFLKYSYSLPELIKQYRNRKTP